MTNTIYFTVVPWLLIFSSLGLAAETPQRLQFNVNDESGRPLPCRIHLFDAAGNPQRAPGQPFFRDHFVCSGRVALDLPTGSYRYIIARGPEYEQANGIVELPQDPARTVTVTLRRIAKLRELRWYSADLHVHRPIEDVEQLMLAEDLDFAPVITWWNQRNLWGGKLPKTLVHRFDGHRLYHVMAGEDEREGGALMFFGLTRPLDIADAAREVPSPLEFVRQARQRDPHVWIDVEKPFWWDVPVWLASGQIQSIGLANNHMCRDSMLANEAWGKPRDVGRLPAPLGNGYWTQEIYYQILNSGLRIPPSAGSASGVLPNPVGYNRVYVHLDGELEHDAWWEGLRTGQCFVTNGPLLVCRANGNLPGSVLQSDGAINVKLAIDLKSRDSIGAIEVVQNGRVVKTLGNSNGHSQHLQEELVLEESGWFLVRVLTDNPRTFRFASTGPFYVEIGDAPRYVSRDAVRFFQGWVAERIDRVERNLSSDQGARDAVLRYHHAALEFWKQRESMVRSN